MAVYTGSAALTQHNMAEHTSPFADLLLMASSYTCATASARYRGLGQWSVVGQLHCTAL